MFGIATPVQLYAKLVLEFDDFCDEPGSSRHAMNFAITAYHLTEWVWKDFLKEDEAKRKELGIAKDINAFPSMDRGEKHLDRANAGPCQRFETFSGKGSADSKACGRAV